MVEAGRSPWYEPIILCAHCHQGAALGETIDETGRVTYTLSCPTLQNDEPVLLGSWLDKRQRRDEIADFVHFEIIAEARRQYARPGSRTSVPLIPGRQFAEFTQEFFTAKPPTLSTDVIGNVLELALPVLDGSEFHSNLL
jgi:hypothetical protein